MKNNPVFFVEHAAKENSRSGKTWHRHKKQFSSLWRAFSSVAWLIILGARPEIFRIVERRREEIEGRYIQREYVSIEFRVYLYDDNYQPGDDVVPLPMKKIPEEAVLPLQ